jgi:hypothetical protein
MKEAWALQRNAQAAPSSLGRPRRLAMAGFVVSDAQPVDFTLGHELLAGRVDAFGQQVVDRDVVASDLTGDGLHYRTLPGPGPG